MRTVTLSKNSIYSGNLILVNKQYAYHDRAANHVLLPVNFADSKVLLEANAVKLFSSIMDKIDAWEQITAVSGWRYVKEQQEILTQSSKDNGLSFTRKYVALPGHSEHQTGLAIDLAENTPCVNFLCPDFPHTGICQEFRKNAVLYGFIERYPQNKEMVTGIAHKPWHFRYVGTPHAEIMKKHNFVLEEYISFLKNYPYGRKSYSYTLKDLHILVSYLEADKLANTQFELDDNIPYSVSGNNIDGYIITEWGRRNGEH